MIMLNIESIRKFSGGKKKLKKLKLYKLLIFEVLHVFENIHVK